MADIPTTKAAIQERFASAVEALNARLATLSDEDLERPGAVGDWSLKDALAHLSSPWLAAQIEALREGREPTAMEAFGHEQAPGPDDDMMTNDGRNAWSHRFEEGLTLQQVRERYRDYVERATAALEAVPADDYERVFSLMPLGYVGRLQPGDEGQPNAPLWRWVMGNTWHHMEDHLGAFQPTAQAN